MSDVPDDADSAHEFESLQSHDVGEGENGGGTEASDAPAEGPGTSTPADPEPPASEP